MGGPSARLWWIPQAEDEEATGSCCREMSAGYLVIIAFLNT
jgi:hypothetical protein